MRPHRAVHRKQTGGQKQDSEHKQPGETIILNQQRLRFLNFPTSW